MAQAVKQLFFQAFIPHPRQNHAASSASFLVWGAGNVGPIIDLAQKGLFPKGSKVLYTHLGGAPALNGYGYYYKDG